MALTNIFKEPRREITETVIGAVAVAIPICLYAAAGKFLDDTIGQYCDTWSNSPCHFGVWFLPFVIMITIPLLLQIIHRIGEDICDSLASHGKEIRPRNRPRN